MMKLITAFLYFYFHYSDAASFFGNSYINLPLLDASSRTNLTLRFLTSRSDAMLMLIAGKIDYCLIVLEKGTLKVRINLGAGEAELSSSSDLQLNDLSWHHISVQRQDAKMRLIIDNSHTKTVLLPGKFQELNIQFGVRVGGLGGFRELLLGKLTSFRGCINDILFNGVDVLSSVLQHGDGHSYQVEWECSQEFTSLIDTPISVTQESAFLLLGARIPEDGGLLHFDIKTYNNHGVVLYVNNQPSSIEFAAVEIVSGKTRLVLNAGNGVFEVTNKVLVNDGMWHRADVEFVMGRLSVTVDNEASATHLSSAHSRRFYFQSGVYVGGVEMSKQALARRQGVAAGHMSLVGCLKNITLMGQKVGFPVVEVSQGIKPNCVWEKYCSKANCSTAACNRTCFKYHQQEDRHKILPDGILALSPLKVKEGRESLLSILHINMNFDYKKYAIEDSGISFLIIELPRHGVLQLKGAGKVRYFNFTFQDVINKKIYYAHDGSESKRDSAMLEVVFKSSGDLVLPTHIEQKHIFRLQINVESVNDKPVINLNSGKTLRIAKGSKKLLGPDILSAFDPDNNASELIYTILNEASESEGYIENTDIPGVRLQSFSQEQILQEKIWFVHQRGINGKLALRVSDGTANSAIALLQVSAFQLRIYLVNNTGIKLTHFSQASILPGNLTFMTNAEDQHLDMHFHIAIPPEYGVIQVLKGNNLWQITDHFSNWQLMQEKVRYKHTTSKPFSDEFKFTVSVADTDFPSTYEFKINFINISLKIVNQKELRLVEVMEAVITPELLLVQSLPFQIPYSEIIYHITKLPYFGNLIIKDGGTYSPLFEGDGFSQADIYGGKVQYILKQKSLSDIYDDVNFRVSAVGQSVPSLMLKILHSPSPSKYFLRMKTLRVYEGGEERITTDVLYLNISGAKQVVYNILVPPQHGRLQLVENFKYRSNVSSFTSNHIHNSEVLYAHDDSETKSDRFRFVAYVMEAQRSLTYVNTFHIEISLVNDNPPQRVVNKPFQVVQNSERLITKEDLEYTDPDLGSISSNLRYTWDRIENGALYHLEQPDVQVITFTQADINNNMILFRHHGSLRAKIPFWVSDGEFKTENYFLVNASDPFLEMLHNTGIVMVRGNLVPISSQNLSIRTNLNAFGNAIKYEVMQGPMVGKLLINGKQVYRFTQRHLDEASLKYQHNGSPSFEDELRFWVSANYTELEGYFRIKIFPESYWKPLLVISNKTLFVEEKSETLINQSNLQVIHKNIAPLDIQYRIKQQPRYGFIHLTSSNFEDTRNPSSNYVTSFDQSDINEGRLVYLQNTSHATRDAVVFEVSNGITKIKDLLLRIDIIPRIIDMTLRNLTVSEGGRQILDISLLLHVTSFYRRKLRRFEVMENPRTGSLEMVTVPGVKIKKFSVRELEEGQVQYVHNGSEVLKDVFSLRANAAVGEEERISNSAKSHVSVIPINDEPPLLVNNSGLICWEGREKIIEHTSLGAVDLDSPPEDIFFYVNSRPTRGFLKVGNQRNITRFTQQDINQHQLVYHHLGGDEEDKFAFNLFDGDNAGSTGVFLIRMRKVRLETVSVRKLHVYPLSWATISSRELLVMTNDYDTSRNITFTITVPPKKGRITNELHQNITHFTQKSVNESLVKYEHIKGFSEASGRDTFSFNISSEFAKTLMNQVFIIDITTSALYPNEIKNFLKLAPLEVKEGGSQQITEQNLNVSGLNLFLKERFPRLKEGQEEDSTFTLSSLPLHGAIIWKNQTIDAGTYFYPTDIRNKSLTYLHDHSDFLNDQIPFHITIRNKMLLFEGFIPVIVTPMNDQPFWIVTKELSMDLIQHEAAVIKRENLQVLDNDTQPNMIKYHVIKNPTQGKLVRRDNLNVSIVNFTQEDINKGQVIFIHNGSPETKAHFSFQVSDGVFPSKFQRFEFRVKPLTLALRNNSGIQIIQGTNVTILKSSQLGAETNGRRELVIYNVTRPPIYGTLLFDEIPVSKFSQINIDRGEIQYVQKNMTVFADSFTTDIQNQENKLKNQLISVVVVPMVSLGNVSIEVGQRFPISGKVLSADQLYKTTAKPPVFSLVTRPKYTKIKKIFMKHTNETKKNIKLKEVSAFSQHDITNGLLFIVSKKMAIDIPVFDNFSYILTAEHVQPARGTFRFRVVPVGWVDKYGDESNDARLLSTETNTGLSMITPNILNDHYLIIGMVSGVLIVVVLILVGIRCSLLRKIKKYDRENQASSEQENVLKNGDIGRVDEAEIEEARDVVPPIRRADSCSRLGPIAPRMNYHSTATLPRHSYNRHRECLRDPWEAREDFTSRRLRTTMMATPEDQDWV